MKILMSISLDALMFLSCIYILEILSVGLPKPNQPHHVVGVSVVL